MLKILVKLIYDNTNEAVKLHRQTFLLSAYMFYQMYGFYSISGSLVAVPIIQKQVNRLSFLLWLQSSL